MEAGKTNGSGACVSCIIEAMTHEDNAATEAGHPNDFIERCKFREQILGIGSGVEYGTGEEVLVRKTFGSRAFRVTP